MILLHEHKDVDEMNDFRSWAQGSRYVEQLRIFIDMNDSYTWVQGSKCYEQLRAMKDMSYSGSWA